MLIELLAACRVPRSGDGPVAQANKLWQGLIPRDIILAVRTGEQLCPRKGTYYYSDVELINSRNSKETIPIRVSFNLLRCFNANLLMLLTGDIVDCFWFKWLSVTIHIANKKKSAPVKCVCSSSNSLRDSALPRCKLIPQVRTVLCVVGRIDIQAFTYLAPFGFSNKMYWNKCDLFSKPRLESQVAVETAS